MTDITTIAADIFTAANGTVLVNDTTTIQTTTSGAESTTTGDTDWKTGIYILAGISVYGLLVVLVVWYCMGRRSGSMCNCMPGQCFQGDCECLKSIDCNCEFPKCPDCCPEKVDCDLFAICDDCCEVEDDTECCANCLPTCQCTCQDINEEAIIQSKLNNDPDYFINYIRNNPQFQRSLREQEAISAFQGSRVNTTQPQSTVQPNFKSSFNTSGGTHNDSFV